VTASISPHWWPNNAGHVVIVPNAHFENIYDLPQVYAHRIQDVAQVLALAMKHTYHCQGISTRQHNEPAGNQDVWHYHLHVFPRYEGDNLYLSQRSTEVASAEQRRAYAEMIKSYLSEHASTK
jgi:histidine triad (HIT) family protein